MDDGHQNFSLRKSLSLVVVDGETGFGNGFQIPAGPLREPVAQGLARADAVVVMGSERSDDGRAAKRAPGSSMRDLESYRGPVLHAHLTAESENFAGQPVFAFAGIGRPEKFTASLEAAGVQVIGSCFFADHHPYTEDEILELKAVAGGTLLVTTEKDFVRLSTASREGIRMLKVAAKFDDTAVLQRLLDSAAPKP
jgi:tetraacyldisaccharide 4'-kinase